MGLGVESIDTVAGEIFDTEDIMSMFAGTVMTRLASVGRHPEHLVAVSVGTDYIIEGSAKVGGVAGKSGFSGDDSGAIEFGPLLRSKLIDGEWGGRAGEKPDLDRPAHKRKMLGRYQRILGFGHDRNIAKTGLERRENTLL